MHDLERHKESVENNAGILSRRVGCATPTPPLFGIHRRVWDGLAAGQSHNMSAKYWNNCGSGVGRVQVLHNLPHFLNMCCITKI